jgi:hypothetical protein
MLAEHDYELPMPLQPKRGELSVDTAAAADSARAGARFAVDPALGTGLPAPPALGNVLPPASVSVVPPALVSTVPPALGPTAGASPARKVIWITFDSGESIPVDRVAVLGREPSISPGADEMPVKVTDSSASISRTHLRVGADANGIWVEDSYSANGTFLIGDNGRDLLERGRRIYLPTGARLGLGERTLQLTVADM